jgi:hypothetical protein
MKKYKKYIGPEDNFQISVASYLDSLGVLWLHVANERQLYMIKSKSGKMYSPLGAKLKKKGVKSGFPDVAIFESKFQFKGLMIELKTGSNKTSDNQKHWLNELSKRGYLCKVSYSLDETIDIINNYLQIKSK